MGAENSKTVDPRPHNEQQKRVEAPALQEYLSRPENTRMESKAAVPQEETKKYFLRIYPEVKKSLKEHIMRLRELADETGSLHKNTTIANLVASSISFMSSLVTTAEILAPVTERARQLLSRISWWLGVTSTSIGVGTNVAEYAILSSKYSEANKLISDSFESLIRAQEILRDYRALCPDKVTSLEDVKQMASNVHKFKSVKDIGDLIREILNQILLLNCSCSAIETSILCIAICNFPAARTAIQLTIDLINMVQQSQDMYNGANTPSAELMRKEADKLEKKLQKLNEIYFCVKLGNA